MIQIFNSNDTIIKLSKYFLISLYIIGLLAVV